MRSVLSSRTGWLIALHACVALLPMAPAAVSAQGARAAFVSPRTPWGDPDLQGTWPSGPLITIPFERAPELGTRASLSSEEVAKRDAALDAALSIPSPTAWLHPHWNEIGRAPGLTSLVVDPVDGRLPKMTSEGEAHQKDVRTTYVQRSNFSRPDDLGPYDRCISRGIVGSMMPVVYNTGTEIMQTPGSVVLRHEMIHETRVVPLDGRAHLSPAIKSYMGNSRGRWDGNTLVVRTVGVNGRNGLDGNGQPR